MNELSQIANVYEDLLILLTTKLWLPIFSSKGMKLQRSEGYLQFVRGVLSVEQLLLQFYAGRQFNISNFVQ